MTQLGYVVHEALYAEKERVYGQAPPSLYGVKVVVTEMAPIDAVFMSPATYAFLQEADWLRSCNREPESEAVKGFGEARSEKKA